MKKIVDRHYEIETMDKPTNDLQDAAIDRFLALRNEGGLIKKPGTSEFLDWLKALQTFTAAPYSTSKLRDETLKSSLPYRELLLKLCPILLNFKQ